ncbi:hypothetical protein CCACVL1_27399 [Corchorus capsularis]|uniref:RRM domain-containing protein n=1 Tax=Corchorus capsularis TaxID=210143 RepID=A0A1R3GAF0_COCAP|nr:hypothetical protein CCACVL1_27399 [Corchorus capsularis]
MAAFLSCPLPVSSFSLQPPKLSTITNFQSSICNAHLPKTFKTSYPSLSLTHKPICCCDSSSQSQSHSSLSTGVFIRGLPQSTAEGRLKKVFSQFGEVNRVEVVRDGESKRSLGSAFVWFNKEESAQLAVKEMNGKVKVMDGDIIEP